MLGLRILPARLASLFALAALIALAAATLTPPITAQEPDGVPERLTLNLELVDDSDGYVQAGSTISVRGQVRLEPGPEDLRISAGDLRLSASQVWENNDRSRLSLSDQLLLTPLIQSGEIVAYTNTGLTTPLGNGQMLRVLAYDGKTIIARGGSGASNNDNHVYVFNAETSRQVGRIRSVPRLPANPSTQCGLLYSGSTCVPNGDQEWGWGRGNDDGTASTVAVWQQDDETAWLFLGSNRASVTPGSYTYGDVGALFVYEIDYSADPVAITERRRIFAPSGNEILSRGIIAAGAVGRSQVGHFGAAVAVSADGSTLAVGARRMHDVGAVYVFSRPTSGWGASFGWNDAVRVEPVAIPAWGDANGEHPFNPESTGRTGAAADCDAYCSRVSSYTGDAVANNAQSDGTVVAHAEFGYYVALSGDGAVLAVSAPRKRWASTTPGGAPASSVTATTAARPTARC